MSRNTILERRDLKQLERDHPLIKAKRVLFEVQHTPREPKEIIKDAVEYSYNVDMIFKLATDPHITKSDLIEILEATNEGKETCLHGALVDFAEANDIELWINQKCLLKQQS